MKISTDRIITIFRTVKEERLYKKRNSSTELASVFHAVQEKIDLLHADWISQKTKEAKRTKMYFFYIRMIVEIKIPDEGD